MSRFIVAIPARYGSTRLPGKPLRLIAGIPMIVRVVQRARSAGADQVVVATDDQRIVDALADQGVDICLTDANHRCGSDRLAECARRLAWPDDAIVVNLQGDEPLAPVSGIVAVAQALASDSAVMSTLVTPVKDRAELFNPNCVKVVCDGANRACYFSRAPIPYVRDGFANGENALPFGIPFLRHIGIYAYRASFLKRFAALPPTPLEQAEALEQLRALEHGFPIAVRMAPESFPAGVDTEEDLLRINQCFANQA